MGMLLKCKLVITVISSFIPMVIRRTISEYYEYVVFMDVN